MLYAISNNDRINAFKNARSRACPRCNKLVPTDWETYSHCRQVLWIERINCNEKDKLASGYNYRGHRSPIAVQHSNVQWLGHDGTRDDGSLGLLLSLHVDWNDVHVADTDRLHHINRTRYRLAGTESWRSYATSLACLSQLWKECASWLAELSLLRHFLEIRKKSFRRTFLQQMRAWSGVSQSRQTACFK